MLFEADPTSAADISVGYGSLMTFRKLRVTTPVILRFLVAHSELTNLDRPALDM
jgi:hypothetical protein